MPTFEELEAQVQGTQPTAPTSFDALAEQAGVSEQPVSTTPVSDDLSLFQRMGNSVGRAASGFADSAALATGLEQEQQEMLLGRDMTAAEAHQVSPTLGQTAMNFGGDAVGLVWDWGADGITEAGQEGFQLLSNENQEGAKEQLRALVDSPVGDMGLKAWQYGDEQWKSFAAKYPMEARTLSKGFDLLPGGKQMKRIKIPTELTPLRLDKTLGRQRLKPPTGRDKDIYNMIVPEQTKQQRLKQVTSGNVDNPRGLGRRQDIIPTDGQWEVVDELKTVPNLSANKTYQQNANLVLDSINDINEKARRIAAGTRGGADHRTVMESIQDRLVQTAQQNPGIFGVDGQKASKTIEGIVAEFDNMLDTNGSTWEGLLRSRQELDNYLLNQMQIGTYGAGKKAGAVTEAHKAIRDVVNSMVTDGVPGTKDMLKRQHLQFKGLDGLAPKAADEASSSLGRLLRELNLHNPTTPLAQMSTLLSPLVWAGAVAVSPFVLAGKAVRGVTQIPRLAESTGAVRNGVRNVISESQKALKLIKDPAVRKQMQTDIKVMATLLHTLPKDEPVKDDPENGG